MSKEGKFGTVITCMDGRVQEPVAKWLKERMGLNFVDTITEPGIDKLMAEGSPEQRASVKAKVLISTNAHGSRVIAVVGHADCAGNPVAKEKHLEHVRQAVATVQSWGLKISIFGLWVGEQWTVEQVCEV
jgi:carbonic anhydrase